MKIAIQEGARYKVCNKEGITFTEVGNCIWEKFNFFMADEGSEEILIITGRKDIKDDKP